MVAGLCALILQRFRQSLLLPVLRYDAQGTFQDLHILAGLYRRNLTPHAILRGWPPRSQGFTGIYRYMTLYQ